MPQTISVSDVPGLLHPGQTVFVQGAVGEPLALGQALAASEQASKGVHYLSCLVPGVNRTDFAAFHDEATMTAFFVQAELQNSFAAGKVRFLPLHYSGICSYMQRHPPVDVLLMQVPPPDDEGMCTLGLSVDFVPFILDKAKVVVAEVNANMPSPPGSPKIPYDRLDYVAGAMDCSEKSIDRGFQVCGAAMGTQRVYDWATDRQDVIFKGANYTHNVPIVAQIDNFVSINSTLEVDLTGQANSETLDGRQISGTGGLVDFVRGARMADNGRSILALSATAARDKISRIVPTLSAGAAVSCPRADIDYVVTEYGAARLKDKSVDERAEALIEIAAPLFHDELQQQWWEQRDRIGSLSR